MNMSINKRIELNKIYLSIDETHHLYNGLPLYDKVFEIAMSFHAPGVAAVMDETGAYHIDLKGEPIYNKRFLKTFGYYNDRAAVMDVSGWYHINLEGESLYKERYGWVGNFQEERCVIRNNQGYYFHIRSDGTPAYKQRYRYAGDFKYGIAVVYNDDGYSSHIDREGKFIYNRNFLELGVYHKGYGIAKDNSGAFHINKNGIPLYNERYKWVEPFYNGFAFVCKHNGEKLIINEQGKNTHVIYDQTSTNIQKSLRNRLMGMLVGYWKTQIIHSIVELQILDLVKNGKNTFKKLLATSQLPVPSLKMIIKVLKIWDFIEEENGIYGLKYLGDLLTDDNPETLKYAALMWGAEHYKVMSKLTDALKDYQPQFENVFGQPVFNYFNINKEQGLIFNKAMKAYAINHDNIIQVYDFSDTRVLIDIGGGTGCLLEKIISQNTHITKGILFDLPSVIDDAKESISDELILEKIEFIEGNFFEKIPLKADTIMMSRVLHDWNDESVIKILNNVYDALEENGKLLILEMVIPETPEYDLGVTLNFNLLVNVGGKERTLKEFKNIFQTTGFKIKSVKSGMGIISLIIAEKIRS